jgi:hypothetical protein
MGQDQALRSPSEVVHSREELQRKNEMRAINPLHLSTDTLEESRFNISYPARRVSVSFPGPSHLLYHYHHHHQHPAGAGRQAGRGETQKNGHFEERLTKGGGPIMGSLLSLQSFCLEKDS